MKLRKGHILKPKLFRPTGQVVFEDKDGKESPGDRFHCVSYGYRYDKNTGMCMIKTSFPSERRQKHRKKINQVTDMGINNKPISNSKSILLTGSNNEVIENTDDTIYTTVQDASVIGGSFGELRRRGEVLIGGGVRKPGYHFSSLIGNCTTDGAEVKNAYLQGIDQQGIYIHPNSITQIDITVIAVIYAQGEGCDEAEDVGTWTTFRNATNSSKNPLVLHKADDNTITYTNNSFVKTAGTNIGVSCTMVDWDVSYGTVLQCTGVECKKVDWLVTYELRELIRKESF